MLRDKFFEGMSRAAATVSIVTTDGPAGRMGITISAMTAVSANSATPSLLICVNEKSATAGAIRQNGVFCVNVLRDDQTYLSNIFAGRSHTESGDRFAYGQWRTLHSAAPVLSDALVSFDCRVEKSFLYGTHWVFVGELHEMALSEGKSALIYANRAYGSPVPLRPIAQTPASSHNSIKLGCSTHSAPFFIGGLMRAFGDAHPDIGIELFEGTQPELTAALRADRIQIAATHGHDLDAGLVSETLLELQPYCLLPEKHGLADCAAVTLAQISREPLVLLDTPPISELILGYFQGAHVEPGISHRVHSLEIVRSLVANRLGYSILFTKPANNMSYDGRALLSMRIADDLPGLALALISTDAAKEQAAVESFRAFCRRYFDAAPSAAVTAN